MTDSDAILVRILAAEDAIRLPIRGDGWASAKLPANRYLRGVELAAHGLPFRAAAEDSATAVQTSRALMDLHNAGILSVRRRPRVKYPYAKLTHQGDARTRALCGLPGREVGTMFLAYAAEWGQRFEEAHDGRRWVPEVWFLSKSVRGDWGQRGQLASIELDYLPAARLGWVDSCSSTGNAVAYCANPKGLAELSDPSPVPDCGKLPSFDPAALTLYRTECDTALLSLASETPTRPNEMGPLPAIHALMFAKPQALEGQQ